MSRKSYILALIISILPLTAYSQNKKSKSSDQDRTAKQIAAQQLFLQHTHDFNQRLIAALAVVRTIKTRQQLEQFDAQSRGTNGLGVNEWYQEKTNAERDGTLSQNKMLPALKSELDLEATLMQSLTSIVIKLIPEMQPKQEPGGLSF